MRLYDLLAANFEPNWTILVGGAHRIAAALISLMISDFLGFERYFHHLAENLPRRLSRFPFARFSILRMMILKIDKAAGHNHASPNLYCYVESNPAPIYLGGT